MGGRVDLDPFLCKEGHFEYCLSVGKGSDKEFGMFLGCLVLQGDVDSRSNLFFDKHPHGVKCLSDADGLKWLKAES